MEDADTETLTRLVETGVERTVHALAEAYPNERLIGYALGTDDDLGTLFRLACTAESALESSPADVRFQFTEWTREASDAAELVAARRLLWSRFERSEGTPSFHDPVEHHRIWDAVVSALVRVRRKGIFPEGVFLTVASTDPSPTLEKWERAAITQLNGPEVLRTWRLWRLHEARAGLGRLPPNRQQWSYAQSDRERELHAEIALLESELELAATTGEEGSNGALPHVVIDLVRTPEGSGRHRARCTRCGEVLDLPSSEDARRARMRAFASSHRHAGA